MPGDRLASPSRRAGVVAAGTALLVAVLTGCGGGGSPSAGPTPTPEPSSVGPTGPTSPTASATLAPSASPTRAARLVVVAATRPGAAFVSPSGNIACEIMGVADPAGSAQVRCDIAQHSYPSPSRPASCPLDYGSSFEIDRRATLLCVGDTVADEAALPGTGPQDMTTWFDPRRDPTVTTNAGGTRLRRAGLPYGESVAYRDVTCTSAPTGVTCRNTRTHAAFTVARASYHLR